MQILVVICFFFVITGIGMVIVNRLGLPPHEIFIGSFVVGSIVVGMIMFILTHMFLINSKVMLSFLAIAGLLAILQIKPVFNSIKSFFYPIAKYAFGEGQFRILFFFSVAVFLLWYLLLASAPPRSGDAMRYHLAQLKDIVQNQGIIFRPYYHYNLPMYFSMMFLPVYYFFDGSVMNIAHTIYFFLGITSTLQLARFLKLKFPKFLIYLFFLTPICFLEAPKVTNDWVLICYILFGMQFLVWSKNSRHRQTTIPLAFLSLGFALGVKYHASLFLPWFVVLSWKPMGKVGNKRKLLFLGSASILAGVIASPWYIKNLINIGNPCWPLLLNLFSNHNGYLHLVAQNHTQYLTGYHSISGTISSLKNFVLSPSLPVSIWLLTMVGFYANKRDDLHIKYGTLSFFVLWWIFQPRLLPRFSTYILPFAFITIVALCELLWAKKNLRVARYLFCFISGLTLAYGFLALAFISKDHFQYHMIGNLDKYHNTTRFYQEYKWINENLPADSKLLVIVSAGQTYYSDLPYLRADPWSSGLVEWTTIKTPEELTRQLRNLEVDAIVYEQCDWSYCPGGQNMMELMQKLPKLEDVRTIWERETKIYFSRTRGLYANSNVILLKI